MPGQNRPPGPDDLSDEEVGRIMTGGTIIGVPLVFVASTLLTIRVGLVNALAIAVLPTLFSGSFVGGLILLMRSLRRAERQALLVPAGPGGPAGRTEPSRPSGPV